MRDLVVRPLEQGDKPAWASLWTVYLEFYESSVAAEVYDIYFDRLLGNDPQDYHCLLAILDDRPVGLAHFLFHRHGWSTQNVCYLQDLYVTPEMRGTGAGRRLMKAVYVAADVADAPNVYWLTQDFNVTARQLYDRIGEKTPFIKYKRV